MKSPSLIWSCTLTLGQLAEGEDLGNRNYEFKDSIMLIRWESEIATVDAKLPDLCIDFHSLMAKIYFNFSSLFQVSPLSEFLLSGSFHKPLSLFHQRAERLKATVTGN